MSVPALSSDLTLARILSSKAATKSSGVVTATRGKLRRVFCIEQGWLVFAASNLIEEQLEEYLVRNGIVSPAARAEAAADAGDGKKPVLMQLVENRALDDGDLRRGMEGLITTLLSSCLEWPDGEYRFDTGRPNLTGKVTVRLSLVQLLLVHSRRYPASLDAVRVRLGPPDAQPRRTPEGERMIETLESDGVRRSLLEACDGSATVGDLLERTTAPENETLRGLYGLLLVGALDTAGRKDGAVASRAEAPLTEEECVAVLRRAENADHYGVLGLDRTAARDQIRSAYYGLARRYHPDRFRAGDLSGFLGQFESYFTHVTEAYNTLFNPELRDEYNRYLDQGGSGKDVATSTAHLARENFLRARALIERRRLQEAATYLENAIQQDDSQIEYHLELGRLLAGNPRRRSDAEEHLLRAAEIDPTSAEPYVALGYLYRKAARDADAARVFREALRWDPGNVEASNQLDEIGDVGGEPETGLLRGLFRSG